MPSVPELEAELAAAQEQIRRMVEEARAGGGDLAGKAAAVAAAQALKAQLKRARRALAESSGAPAPGLNSLKRAAKARAGPTWKEQKKAKKAAYAVRSAEAHTRKLAARAELTEEEALARHQKTAALIEARSAGNAARAVIIPHQETFSTTIQPPYSPTKGSMW
jgi:hypothetical protein